MVQICKENCPKPSHQTSHIRCAWHLLGPVCSALPSTDRYCQVFLEKTATQPHTSAISAGVEDRKAESFSRACKHPSTFLKDHVLQNTAHRKASCSCSRWAGGRTAAYKEQVLEKVKVGPFYGKGWHTAPILHTTDKHRAEGCDHLPGDLWGETMHKYYLHGRERDCSVRWREEVENCKDRSSCSVEGFCLETISPI